MQISQKLLQIEAQFRKTTKEMTCRKSNNHATEMQDSDLVEVCTLWVVFTVRRYPLHGLSYRNSVRLSVCPSVTLVDCVHMVRPTIMVSSPDDSPIILVSGDITFIPKFEGSYPERGR